MPKSMKGEIRRNPWAYEIYDARDIFFGLDLIQFGNNQIIGMDTISRSIFVIGFLCHVFHYIRSREVYD